MKSGLAFLLLSATCCAQEIKFVNTMPEEIELWVWNRGTKTWHAPIFMAKGANQSLNVAREGKAYLAMKDARKRVLPIGWVDLHEYAKYREYVGLSPLYQSQGWLTGWKYDEDGELVPTWRPLTQPYAWRVRLQPMESGTTITCQMELIFRNSPDVEHIEEMDTTTYHFYNITIPATQ